MLTQNPWSDFARPTMRFNEALVDGWISQPANAWTNIFYIIIGLVLFYKICRNKTSVILYTIPASAVLIGLASFLYHASNTFLFQFFDLSSMFLISTLLIVLNIYRLKPIGTGCLLLILGGLILVSSLLLLLIRSKSGLVIFGLELFTAIILELIILKNNKKSKTVYSNFIIALAIFLCALGIWILDYTGHSCFNPENHWMQGHGMWHIINAFCFLYLYKFYDQFDW
jgi:hypothetical protein